MQVWDFWQGSCLAVIGHHTRLVTTIGCFPDFLFTLAMNDGGLLVPKLWVTLLWAAVMCGASAVLVNHPSFFASVVLLQRKAVKLFY
jgi:hypothetical protein